MKNKHNDNQLLMYTTADGKTALRVAVSPTENTVWLTQKQMAELFQTTRENVTMHIGNVFDEGELEPEATSKDFLLVQKEGERDVERSVVHYNLDMIISVGYRVKSLRGTQFRIWATKVLNEYIRKGFAMNDELLKEAGGGNYFKELIGRIRDIRSSEKVFYRQVLDIYATSIDYDPKAETTKDFFKLVQNKMFYAINGHTAPEIIMYRANAELPFMGLTAFRGNQPQKSEVNLAKNYLSEHEIKKLNRIVSMYLDYAEEQAENGIPMKMADWVGKLDGFLKFNNKEILCDGGKVSREAADKHAELEYSKYKEKSQDALTQVEQDFLEDIKATYRLLENKNDTQTH